MKSIIEEKLNSYCIDDDIEYDFTSIGFGCEVMDML